MGRRQRRRTPNATVCAGRPLLYVYADLPARFRFTDAITDLGVGPAVPGPWDERLGRGAVHATHQWAAPVLIDYRARAYECRTSDPASADLFYVPAFATQLPANRWAPECGVPGNSTALPLPPALTATRCGCVSCLQRRRGADHFLATRLFNPLCTLDTRDARLLSVVTNPFKTAAINGVLQIFHKREAASHVMLQLSCIRTLDRRKNTLAEPGDFNSGGPGAEPKEMII